MATMQALLIEANNRGILTGRKKELFDEAMSRGLIQVGEQVETTPKIKLEPQKSVKGGIFQKASDFFTGADRTTPETESAPSIFSLTDPLSTGSIIDDVKLSARLLTTLNPEEQGKIITKAIPNSKIISDSKNNLFVDVGGKRHAINKPGFSLTDAFQLAGGAAAFAPASEAAIAAKGGQLIKAAVAGIGAATTQAGIEELQKTGGGEFNEGDIVAAGLLGGVFQGITSAGQAVFRKFINANNGKFATKEIEDLIKTSEKEGVELFVDDVAKTTFVKQIGTTAEKIPIAGTVKGRLRQSEQQLAAARNLKASIVKEIDDTAEEVQRSFSKKLNEKKEVVGRKFAEAANDIDPAGNIPTSQFIKTLDEQIEKQSNKIFPNKPLIETLEKLRDVKPANFSQTREVLTELNENISAFFKGERELIGGRGVGSLMAAKRALEDDVDNFVKTTGTKAGKDKFDEAKKLFIEFEVPFIENRRLAKLVKTDEPEDVFNFILAKTGKAKGIQSRAKKAFNLLNDEGRDAVKTEIINRAFNDSLKDIGGREVLSAAQFANNLEKFDNISKVFFNKADKSRIDGIVKLFRATQRASQVAENPPTGLQLFIPGALAVTVGSAAASLPTTILAVGGFSAATKLLYQSKAGRTLLLGLNKATPGTKLFDSRVLKIEEFLQKVAVPQLSQREDNAKL